MEQGLKTIVFIIDQSTDFIFPIMHLVYKMSNSEQCPVWGDVL